MDNKITLEQINSKIKGESYIVLPDGRSTLCMLSMENGFTITGVSACVDPANFNMATGRDIAKEDALGKIWSLEGYLLAERLHQAAIAKQPPPTVYTVNTKLDPVKWGFKKDGTPKRRPGRPAAK